MNDEPNILPILSHIRSITPVPVKEDSKGLSEAERDLKKLKDYAALGQDTPKYSHLASCSWPWEICCTWFSNCWSYCCREHLDFDVVKSNNPEFKKATARINIYKQHRQTIQHPGSKDQFHGAGIYTFHIRWIFEFI